MDQAANSPDATVLGKIPLNRPLVVGTELDFISKAIEQGKAYSKSCEDLLRALLGAKQALLTPSCTASLEMAALLAGISERDEVIMPSFTFVSTGNAFVLRGARIVFVDIRPETMNMDERLIEAALTERTKAIVPVHYNGVGCEMDTIMQIADSHGLTVIEDNAQGIGAFWRGRPLGSIGHIGTISFDHMKNLTTGEGGLIAINDEALVESAYILRDKGTNRSQFLSGMVEKYHWTDVGSNFVMNEITSAALWAQLQRLDTVSDRRRDLHARYADAFAPLIYAGLIENQTIPDHCTHNGHIFYIKLSDGQTRSQLIDHLKRAGISTAFHYVPLHSSPAGQNFGRFVGEDRWTTRESGRLLRLPIYFGLSDSEQNRVVEGVFDFFAKHKQH